jgi:hypothetical protein
MASLDPILREFGRLSRRETSTNIKELIRTNLTSEQEIFLMNIVDSLANGSQAPIQSLKSCARLLDLKRRQQSSDRSLQERLSVECSPIPE